MVQKSMDYSIIECLAFRLLTIWIVIGQAIKTSERAQVDVFLLLGSRDISWSSKKLNMSQ